MVGGDPVVLDRVRSVLRAMGPNIFHVGPVGAGNTVKAINNMKKPSPISSESRCC